MLSTYLTALAIALASLASVADAVLCNGHHELCSRKYSNVTFVGSHDSPFIGDDIADNQHISIAEQLAMGVRFLQAQTHYEDDDTPVIKLCHTACFLRDAGPLEDFLMPIKEFLVSNPTEVITLLLTNPDNCKNSEFNEVFERVGLLEYVFKPGKTVLEPESWPMLGEMMASGQRLVVFMDYPGEGHFPYILNEFKDHYLVYSSLDDLAHCPIDRPSGAGPDDGMVLVNHWLQRNDSGVLVPQRCMAIVTNSEQYITRHVQSCQRTLGKTPNFILLDWVDVGDAMLVQDVMNGFRPRALKQDTTVALEAEECKGLPGGPDNP